MPAPRSKSISTKVTEEEYAQFEILAGDQTISEWVREVLLTAAEPSPAEQTIVAELLALRMILMNIRSSIANREQLTSTAMDDIIKLADGPVGEGHGASDKRSYGTTEGLRDNPIGARQCAWNGDGQRAPQDRVFSRCIRTSSRSSPS